MVVYGVYDGHSGSVCADYLQTTLHKAIFNFESGAFGPESLKESFRKTDSAFLNWCLGGKSSPEEIAAMSDEQIASIENSGSTAVVLVTTDVQVHIAHVGDSRAVGFRLDDGKAKSLTSDHKAVRPDERRRIEAAQGRVASRRVNGVIAVSRSFGDIEYKSLKERAWGKTFEDDLLTCVPEICVLPRYGPESMDFFLLATDGVWDVLSAQEAVNIVREDLAKTRDVHSACVSVIRESLFRNSDDDITVLIVNMKSSEAAFQRNK